MMLLLLLLMMVVVVMVVRMVVGVRVGRCRRQVWRHYGSGGRR